MADVIGALAIALVVGLAPHFLFPGPCKAPGWLPDDDPGIDKPYRCTRRRRHLGDHVAHGVGNVPICSWPRQFTLVTDHVEASS